MIPKKAFAKLVSNLKFPFHDLSPHQVPLEDVQPEEQHGFRLGR